MHPKSSAQNELFFAQSQTRSLILHPSISFHDLLKHLSANWCAPIIFFSLLENSTDFERERSILKDWAEFG
jgi:hypothetical protein